MSTVLFWLSAAAAIGLLLAPRTRNAGYFAVSGTIMWFFLHYNIAWIPEVSQVAMLLWAAAIVLTVAKLAPPRRGRRTV